MNKLYDRIYWHNNTTPALNESNLNAMSKAIADIDDRVVEIAGNIMTTIPQLEEDLETAQELIGDLEDLNEHTPYIGANGNWWVWNTTTKEYEDTGVDASISVQIADITMLAPSATPYVTNTGTPTDPIFHLFIPRGHGISSVEKTSTSGLVDTYTMTFSDGSTFTYTVTNGADGKTAYESAVDGGYTGTESEFNAELADLPSYATNAAQSALNASESALAASGSASDAEDSAEDSEAWAVGQRGGVDVPPTDPTYHNNAKYWSEQRAGQSLEGLSDVDLANLSNGQGLKYNSTSKKWENGTVGDMTVETYAKNAAPYAVETSMAIQLLYGNFDDLTFVGRELYNIWGDETERYTFTYSGNSYAVGDDLICFIDSLINMKERVIVFETYDYSYTDLNGNTVTGSPVAEGFYFITETVPNDCDITQPFEISVSIQGPLVGAYMCRYKGTNISISYPTNRFSRSRFFIKNDGTLGYYDTINHDFKTTGSGSGGNPILPINPDSSYKNTPGAIWIEA